MSENRKKGPHDDPENPGLVFPYDKENRPEVSDVKENDRIPSPRANSAFVSRSPNEEGGAPDNQSEKSFSDYIEYFKSWFFRNNPFYLISVFLMFSGLRLISGDNSAGSGSGSLLSLISFYLVQNIYEFLILGIALYLILKKINGSSGKLLLFFIFVFLADATMYQAAIVGTCGHSSGTAWVGLIISSLYLVFAIIKIGLAIYLLKIAPRAAMIFYALAAYAIIYFSRHYSGYLITGKISDVSLFGWWELYAVWLVAALIQLPVIFNTWWKSSFIAEVKNDYIGDENNFYAMLLVIPFIALPLQIVLNVHPDLATRSGVLAETVSNATYFLVPYFLFGAFFMEGILYETMKRLGFELDVFDAVICALIYLFAEITQPLQIQMFGDHLLNPHQLNIIMIVAFTLFVAVSRKNRMCLAIFAFEILYYSKTFLAAQYDYIIWFFEKFKKLSTMSRAYILVALSFIFLALGFLLSLVAKPGKIRKIRKNPDKDSGSGQHGTAADGVTMREKPISATALASTDRKPRVNLPENKDEAEKSSDGLFASAFRIILTVFVIACILNAIATPGYRGPRPQTKKKYCVSNMKMIEGSVELYQMENSVPAGTVYSTVILKNKGYLKTEPRCAGNGTYTIETEGTDSVDVICNIHGRLKAQEGADKDRGL